MSWALRRRSARPCRLPLFDPAAVEALFQASQGLPRKINLLAHHTLIAAALQKAQAASADHVQAALAEVA